MKERPSISDLLTEAAAALGYAGVPDPVRQARDLLCLATGLEKAFVIAHPDHNPEPEQAKVYAEFIGRRANREPFQQIAGRQEFYGLEFLVTPDIMIPRPETELIVEAGINVLRGNSSPMICEVGTGSGCIVVPLLHQLPDARAVGLEISDAARLVTAANASSIGVDDRLDLRESDIFSALQDGEKFDLIVSNPPYVPAEDVKTLQPEVRDFEPLVALTDGAGGLSIIERIIAGSPSRLEPGGHLLLEIGFNQSTKVLAMFDASEWSSASAFPDLQGIPRMIKASLSVS